MTALLPIANIMTMIQTALQTKLMLVMASEKKIKDASLATLVAEMGLKELWIVQKTKEIVGTMSSAAAKYFETTAVWLNTHAWIANAAAAGAWLLKTMLLIGAMYILIDVLGALGAVLASLAMLHWLVGLGKVWKFATNFGPAAPVVFAGIAAAGAAALLVSFDFIKKQIESRTGQKSGASADQLPAMKFNKERNYDLGGTFMPASYDNGGFSTEHGTAVLQKGETVVSKTANMLGSGVTLNFGDIHAQDGTDFAEKVATALPDALRRANDQGAI